MKSLRRHIARGQVVVHEASRTALPNRKSTPGVLVRVALISSLLGPFGISATLSEASQVAATADRLTETTVSSVQTETTASAAPVLLALCRLDPRLCRTASDARRWSGAVNPSKDTSRDTPLSGAKPFASTDSNLEVSAGTIDGTLRDTLNRSNLPAGVVAKLTKLFGARFDASAKAQPGDTYRIVYERADSTGEARPTAIDLRLAGKSWRAAWFDGGYYSFDGAPLSAMPFAVPLAFRRISSPFGMRTHPVFGEPRMHTGVDFAAPVGTPVHAAAGGVVRRAGWERGYGNCVVVGHADGYVSIYGHLSSIATGLRAGMTVAQGQDIGKVGSTGTSTGPHLHFEVRLADRPVDPLTLTSLAPTPPLADAQRIAFDRMIGTLRERLAAAPITTRTASVEHRTVY